MSLITWKMVGNILTKPRMIKLCEAMGLEPAEQRLIIDRFSAGKTIEQCPYISPKAQFRILPILTKKLNTYFKQNVSFFNYHELEYIFKELDN